MRNANEPNSSQPEQATAAATFQQQPHLNRFGMMIEEPVDEGQVQSHSGHRIVTSNPQMNRNFHHSRAMPRQHHHSGHTSKIHYNVAPNGIPMQSSSSSSSSSLTPTLTQGIQHVSQAHQNNTMNASQQYMVASASITSPPFTVQPAVQSHQHLYQCQQQNYSHLRNTNNAAPLNNQYTATLPPSIVHDISNTPPPQAVPMSPTGTSSYDPVNYYDIKSPTTPISQEEQERLQKFVQRQALSQYPQHYGNSHVPLASVQNNNDLDEENKLQIQQIEDCFSEMVDDEPLHRDRLLIVLDAANIGWHYGTGVTFLAEGVSLAIDHLLKAQSFMTNRGNADAHIGENMNAHNNSSGSGDQSSSIEVRAFIPQYYFRAKPKNGGTGNALMQTENVDILEDLVQARLLAPVPPNDSDDAYILNYARENNGFIISNDHFRDHLQSISNPSIRLSMQIWLQENRCSYTFHGNEFIINPTSRLAFALRSKQANNAGHPDPSLVQFMPWLLKAETTILKHLTTAGEELFKLHRSTELKFILLARSHMYLECGSFDAALKDIQYILQNIDPNCQDAWHLMEQLKTINEKVDFN